VLHYILPVRGGAVSRLIAMKFGTLIELTYIINFAKFGVDRLEGWGLVSRQTLGVCLNLPEKPSLTLHSANAHDAVMPRNKTNADTNTIREKYRVSV